ncbi:MAG: hypothetical protein A3D24_04205 [Candidatus Blackburnbacteria bacterium RIFCSPHIGHO2_02_FULL_39_13]|uniref:Uncharacterized protein n=1 Tax=Candidatus Blackburnbacteria bacterium RIFCSPLOWO2_01_FULL_40_20 TaxID=1797519 RepID=A0A1G1VB17_9BACT|nr:MAG: hypothetical protein UT38_C0002G0022 [Microgenomates group bacterium GW2011_GWA2_39_19]OGY07380.1 MAG: hypothetical protein A2694_01980 [Candidatus Blackburnbacteria bacterium RIFCSPHIGHO2_01_FULL_40_17]OGY09860.1 MAG: hypothetical protein A3D24_04205 [Candidatus Blackburnbacteria bacterium RIFCSPHIGHO2_02_FULL_39_13]OGY12467.1 MAG: hypothetical protein A3A77_00625 [Candidatus Blackburnbacteria bacterium RIFCSPLOWO2_01_FULL_40_20]HBL52328.1 hypothetical protein [Candidatus Blackburnbact
MKEFQPRPGDNSLELMHSIKQLLNTGFTQEQCVLYLVWRNSYGKDASVFKGPIDIVSWLKKSGKIGEQEPTENLDQKVASLTEGNIIVNTMDSEKEQSPSFADLPYDDQVKELIRIGFSEQQINNLDRIRKNKASHELTLETRRLEFGRWLKEQGLVTDWPAV